MTEIHVPTESLAMPAPQASIVSVNIVSAQWFAAISFAVKPTIMTSNRRNVHYDYVIFFSADVLPVSF